MTALTRPRTLAFRAEPLAMGLAIIGLVAVAGVAWEMFAERGRWIAASVAAPRNEEVVMAYLTPNGVPPAQPPRPVPRLVPPPQRRPRLAAVPLRLRRSTPRPTAPRPVLAPLVRLADEARRVRVADERGHPVVARVYGGPDSRVVLLPDGRLGWPNGMVYTDEPFAPRTAEQLADELATGPYRHFKRVRTDHYLIFHTCTDEFARQSGVLLESLYRGLSKKFRELGLPVHEAEFPLVAVIFRSESEFREHRDVARDVEACYDVLSNRIFFFEAKDTEPETPKSAAIRKPQTVGHEGTHQVLQNIGVQPRLAPWPPWLIEGLAEFGSSSATKGGEWAGFGVVNPLHVTTIRELEDTQALQGRDRRLVRDRFAIAQGRQAVLDLLLSDDLAPTDYALAWGLTYYLAAKRTDDFVAFLRQMAAMKPLDPRGPAFADREFRRIVAADPGTLGPVATKYVAGLKRADGSPYYAVIFEQKLGDGLFRRGTLVSQSPLVIRQWVDAMAQGTDAEYVWQACPCPTRSAALFVAEKWTGGK